GMQLAVAMDTLVRGVHYPPDTPPADIGWKALAVNLSDLAAMGAEPLWALLALTLPDPQPAWLDAFLDGWCALAQPNGVVLVGGDTTRGPESITVTLAGQVPSGAALLRSGAVSGDRVWVTGSLGDAAAALADAVIVNGAPVNGGRDPWLLQRLRRPSPRLALGLRLRGLATSCIDVSDGLLADLGHVLGSSGGLGAELSLSSLPTSDALALRAAESRWPLQLAGGDDYELCFTAPVSRDAQVRAAAAGCGHAATPIGRAVVGSGVRVLHEDGSEYVPPRRGYQHFT